MNKKVLIFLTLLVAAAGAIAYWQFNSNSNRGPVSQLTGLKVSQEEAERPILGVMVENSEAARPQRGLNQAGIVYETVTEGGITRYLALYQEDQPDVIGPVRSLRVHFLDWAMGFDATIAHVGGSPEALELVKSRDAKSMNQFNFGEPYYRDNSRQAPHNVYAKTSALREVQQKEEFGYSSFTDIPRSKTPFPENTPAATNINIDFSRPSFAVEFRYDAATGKYTRYLAGAIHTDAFNNQPTAVDNLIVLRVKTSDGRVDATGTGKAFVFKDGKVLEANWSKPDFEDRVIITDRNNEEIPLKRGSTWIAALPENKPLKY